MTEAEAQDHLTHIYACGCQVIWYIPHPAGGPSAMRCSDHAATTGPCDTDVRPRRLAEALAALGPQYEGLLDTINARQGSLAEDVQP